MTVKVFIDLTTDPFAADLVFPNGMPPGGYVTLVVGCCQQSPQWRRKFEKVPTDKDGQDPGSITVVRKACRIESYKDFCRGKIMLRHTDNGKSGIDGDYLCTLRLANDATVLSSSEHQLLHLEREDPEVFANHRVINSRVASHNCSFCAFSSTKSVEQHETMLHGSSVPPVGTSCMVCGQVFRREDTFRMHMCRHAQQPHTCSTCGAPFLSQADKQRHEDLKMCSPHRACQRCREPLGSLARVLQHRCTVSPPPTKVSPELPEAPEETPAMLLFDCVQESPAGPVPQRLDREVKKLPRSRAVKPEYACPHCPHKTMLKGVHQIHLRHAHAALAPLKCPQCPRRFFQQSPFVKHRAVCLRRAKKMSERKTQKRWNKVYCEMCTAFTDSYEALMEHYKSQHPEKMLTPCTQCSHVFAHYAYLLAHQAQEHPPEKAPEGGVPCTLCGEQAPSFFKTPGELRDHILECHAPAPLYHCQDCSQDFSLLSALRTHRQQVHTEDPLQCSECLKRLATRSGLRKHVRITHRGEQEMRFSCTHCFRRYGDQRALHLHMALSHYDDLTEQEKSSLMVKQRRCDQCTFESFSGKRFRRHVAQCHGGGGLVCPQCPPESAARFALGCELAKHVRLVHSTEGRRRCPTCPRTFLEPQRYEHHLLLHRDGIGFECPVCNRLFESEPMLINHRNTQQRGGMCRCSPFRCALCRKFFRTEVTLARHMAAHKDAEGGIIKEPRQPTAGVDFLRPLSCEQCNMRFKYHSSLAAHQMAAHSEGSHRRLPTSGAVVTCKVCQKQFKSTFLLSEHIRSHTGERPFGCSDCPATFAQRSVLREHIIRKHSKAFRVHCPLCPKGFVSRHKLRLHLHAVHKATGKNRAAASAQKVPRATTNVLGRTRRAVVQTLMPQEASATVQLEAQSALQPEVQPNESIVSMAVRSIIGAMAGQDAFFYETTMGPDDSPVLLQPITVELATVEVPQDEVE